MQKEQSRFEEDKKEQQKRQDDRREQGYRWGSVTCCGFSFCLFRFLELSRTESSSDGEVSLVALPRSLRFVFSIVANSHGAKEVMEGSKGDVLGENLRVRDSRNQQGMSEGNSKILKYLAAGAKLEPKWLRMGDPECSK